MVKEMTVMYEPEKVTATNDIADKEIRDVAVEEETSHSWQHDMAEGHAEVCEGEWNIDTLISEDTTPLDSRRP